MKTLYFLRHAIAVERGSPGFAHDADRPLTPEGTRKMRRIARELRHRGVAFDVLLSSPFVRARETAEIVAREFECPKKLEFCEFLAAGGDSAALIRLLNARHAGADSVMLVGHEPDLSRLISRLLLGHPRLPLELKKGGLVRLAVAPRLRHGKCATLEWLLAPRCLLGG